MKILADVLFESVRLVGVFSSDKRKYNDIIRTILPLMYYLIYLHMLVCVI